MACLPAGSRVTSRPGLQPKAMSGLLVLLQPKLVLTLMTHGVLCWCTWLLIPLKATLMPGIWAPTQDNVCVWRLCCHWSHAYLNVLHCHLWPWLYPCRLSRTMSGCVVLSQPGSVLMFMAQVPAKGHIHDWNLCSNLWPYWHWRAMPPPGPCWFKWQALPPRAMLTSRTELPYRAMSRTVNLQQ